MKQKEDKRKEDKPVKRNKKSKEKKEAKPSNLNQQIMEKGKLGEKVEEIFKNSKLQRGLAVTGEIQQDHVN